MKKIMTSIKANLNTFIIGLLIGILLVNIYVVIKSDDVGGLDITQLSLLVAAMFWVPLARCSKTT